MRVQSLSAENMTLKSEINKLTESSDKLKVENAALMVRIRDCFGYYVISLLIEL